jgi:prevent-host-death family protein
MERGFKTMKASEFKAKCLKLMDQVQKSGKEIVITKNGRPVSKLVPYHTKAHSLRGLHRGKIDLLDEDIFSTGEPWHADK